MCLSRTVLLGALLRAGTASGAPPPAEPVIDPTLGPRMTDPIVTARSATRFISVWSEWNGSVRFARFGLDGALLDPDGVQALSACESVSQLVCDSGSDRCLLTGRCLAKDLSTQRMFALIDAANGTIVTTGQSVDTSVEDVVSTGTEFLVVERWPNGPPSVVHVTRVNAASGAQSGPFNLTTMKSQNVESERNTLQIAYGGSELLLAESSAAGDGVVSWQDATSFATVGTPYDFPDGECFDSTAVKVGPNYFVACDFYAAPNVLETRLIRIRASDHAILDSSPLEVLARRSHPLRVDGDGVLVFFASGAARVSTVDGTISSWSEPWSVPPLAVPRIPRSQAPVAVACEQGVCRVSVSEGDTLDSVALGRLVNVARSSQRSEVAIPTDTTLTYGMTIVSGDTYAVRSLAHGQFDLLRIAPSGNVLAATPLVWPKAYGPILGTIGSLLVVAESIGGSDSYRVTLRSLSDLAPIGSPLDLNLSYDSALGFAGLSNEGLLHWKTNDGIVGLRISADGSLLDAVDRVLPTRSPQLGNVVATTDGYVGFYVTADGTTVGAQRLTKDLELLDPTGVRLEIPFTNPFEWTVVSSGEVLLAAWSDHTTNRTRGAAFRASDLAAIAPGLRDLGLLGSATISPETNRSFVGLGELVVATPGLHDTYRATISWIDISDAEWQSTTSSTVDTFPPVGEPGAEAGAAEPGAPPPPIPSSPEAPASASPAESDGCQLGFGPRPSGAGIASLLVAFIALVERRRRSRS